MVVGLAAWTFTGTATSSGTCSSSQVGAIFNLPKELGKSSKKRTFYGQAGRKVGGGDNAYCQPDRKMFTFFLTTSLITSSSKHQELTFSQRWLGGTTSLPGYLCKVQPCARSKSQTQQMQNNVELDKIENTFLTNCKCFSSRCKGPMFKTHCSFLLPNTASAHLLLKNLEAVQ